MASKQKKFPCFWCYSVPIGLYSACLQMLNMRCLSIVFDLDETLIVANTMKSFEDRIEALRGWLAREMDPIRSSGMSAEMRRYMEDRALLKQYLESDSVVDSGGIYRAQQEEVLPLSEGQERVVRPVIRLEEKNVVLTRINPEVIRYIYFLSFLCYALQLLILIMVNTSKACIFLNLFYCSHHGEYPPCSVHSLKVLVEVDELHVVIYLWSKGLVIDFLVVGCH